VTLFKREVQRGLDELIRRNPIGRSSRQADLEQARQLQARLIPREAPKIAGYEIAFAWQTSPEVNSDFFDFIPLDESKLALYIADVSGKGMGAATLANALHAAVLVNAPAAGSPAELCTLVNQALSGRIAPGQYATIFYGMLDCASGRLQYENAGHCLPLLVRADGGVEFPASFSGVLGLFSHWLYQNQEIPLRSGDRLLLMTDGIIEAQGRRGEEFGYQRLISLALDAKAHSAQALSQGILDAVVKFCDGKLRDDAAIVVLKVN
jgi:phosphoserine phosphatase RsbU/P